jgi:hypothetical protein
MEKIIIALHNELEKKHNIKQYHNSLKSPYEYFKKLNILPLNIVEGELDKYFTFEELLFEDFKNYHNISIGHILNRDCPNFHKTLYDNVKTYYNYHNAKIEYCKNKDIPQELLTLNNFRSYYRPMEMLWKIVSEDIKQEFKYDLIYNYELGIGLIVNTIKDLQDKQKKHINAQKYKIPVDKLPPNSLLEIEYNSRYYSRYNEIIILKVCNKIIKYMENQFGYDTIEEQLNSLTKKLRQVKKQDLEDDLVNNIYKLKDYDTGKYYIYENGIVKLTNKTLLNL